LERVTVHSGLAMPWAVIVTVPVGVPAICGSTVTVKVLGVPYADVPAGDTLTDVVEVAWSTLTVAAPVRAGTFWKFESPL
jgi:hypothetical protein